MDKTTALILSDAIDGFMEQAEGMSLVQLKELVQRKLAEQAAAPELLEAWAAVDEGGAR